MNSISRYLYLYSPFFSNYGLDYYGWSYYATRNIEETSALAKWAGVLGMKKLISVLKERKADAIVSTFPFGGISHQLQKHGIHIPLFTVVTDFSLHSRWLHNRPDRFYVATDDLKQEMIRRGVRPETITVSGIPLREPFYEPPFPVPPDAQRHPRSILVMMGACVPLPDIQQLTASLLSLPDVRVDIVCGGNDKLRRKLERRFGGHPRLRLFGFVDAVHDRMRRASCIITKAGGITLSEAIQIRTPIVIYKPFSGQERENALYLERKGAAAVAKKRAAAPPAGERNPRLRSYPGQNDAAMRRARRRACRRYDRQGRAAAGPRTARRGKPIHSIGVRNDEKFRARRVLGQAAPFLSALLRYFVPDRNGPQRFPDFIPARLCQ